nr:unnamed protein product [Spirometra erinaceieuropaei]
MFFYVYRELRVSIETRRDGADALRRELELEMMRIAERNLGRDDRMIGDHGREARFPFLDEAVVSFLSALPVSEKADFSLPRGQGEKRLLRLAALQLGLSCASALPKRAMQFGTRIAKVNRNHTVHGADRTLFVDDLE